MKSQLRIGIILLIVLAVFTVIAFAVPFEHTAVFWISYAMGVFALLVLGFVLLSMFGKGTRRNCDGGYDIDGLRVSLIKNPRR